MRKATILFVIGVTSLAIMACGLGGIAVINFEEHPPQPGVVTEIPSITEKSPLEDSQKARQTANTPVPTVDPVETAKSCLVKTWEINGLSDYVIAAVPPDLAEEYDLQYQDTSGQAYFILSPEGEIKLQAENLEFLFTAGVSIFEVPVTVQINGTAVGNYEVDGTILTTSNMDTSGLTASAQALNEDLIEPEQIINSIPFINPPFNTAKYTCQGDTLELTLAGYPGNIPPLVFQVVE